MAEVSNDRRPHNSSKWPGAALGDASAVKSADPDGSASAGAKAGLSDGWLTARKYAAIWWSGLPGQPHLGRMGPKKGLAFARRNQ